MKRIKSKFLNAERFVLYFEKDMIFTEIRTNDNYNNFNDNWTNEHTNMNCTRNFHNMNKDS